MNKYLRYTTHILAILMMAGSMQANRAYFSNKTDETIHVDVSFCFEHGTGKIWLYNKLEVYPDARWILCLPTDRDLARVGSSTTDERIVVDNIRLSDLTGSTVIYSRGSNPKRDDVYITYKGDGKFEAKSSSGESYK